MGLQVCKYGQLSPNCCWQAEGSSFPSFWTDLLYKLFSFIKILKASSFLSSPLISLFPSPHVQTRIHPFSAHLLSCSLNYSHDYSYPIPNSSHARSSHYSFSHALIHAISVTQHHSHRTSPLLPDSMHVPAPFPNKSHNQIENSFPSGPFHLIKLLSFFYPTNVNWQLDQMKKKKHSAAPPGMERWSSNWRSDALTPEVRSHGRNCVWIFVFHQAVSSFSLRGDPHVRVYKHVETNDKTRWI